MPWGKRTETARWPAGIPKPCIPSRGEKVPYGDQWLHEIKHDGYRMIVRKDSAGARVYTRGGYDWTDRYPLIVNAAGAIKESFLIDGEAVVCGPDGIADFAMLHSRQHNDDCFLYAFDLLEIGGRDIRERPLDERKSRLEKLLARSKSGIVYSEHVESNGEAIFAAACKLGLEGIISKQRYKPYTSGPCKHWIKIKNPNGPWAKRLQQVESNE